MSLPTKVSDSFRRLHPEIYGTNIQPENTREDALMERHPSDGMAPTPHAKEKAIGKFLVRVTSFRHRLLDEDNICEKYHVDLCRYAGILPSDAPSQTRITTTQQKIGSKEEEFTLVEIETE